MSTQTIEKPTYTDLDLAVDRDMVQIDGKPQWLSVQGNFSGHLLVHPPFAKSFRVNYDRVTALQPSAS